MQTNRVLLVVLIVLATRLAIAAEAPAEPPVAEGSISAAKKSFETLGKKRTAADRGTALPQVAAPELTILAPSSSAAKQRQPSQVSKEWLVDGVMGKTATRTDNSSLLEAKRIPGKRNKEADDLMSVETTSAVENRPSSRGGNEVPVELDPTRGASPTSAMNPLASFMNSWISTQDRALLLPSAGSELNAIRPASDSIRQSFGPSAPNTDQGEGSFLATGTTKAGSRENPFLMSDAPATLRQGVEGSSGLVARPPGPAAIRPFDVGLRELSPVAGPVAPSDKSPGSRELGKRDDEAKYFRQLKRF